MLRRSRWPWGIVLGIVLGTAAAPLSATTLLKLERLPELVEESRRAVLGRVVAVRHGFDEHRAHSTHVTLAVEDVLFGENVPPPGRTLSIKLYGAPVALEDGSRVFVDGTPQYRPGQRYLLLLLDDSSLGFTNTAGLFQGVFRVDASPEGRVARSLAGNHNAFGTEGLASWLDEPAPPATAGRGRSGGDAPVPYASLREAIVRLHGSGSRPMTKRR